jgi:WD40 repeat protein
MSGIIATCGSKVETWSLTGTQIEPLASMAPHTGKVNMVQWNHNGKVLAAAGSDGFISLNHVKGQLLDKLPTPQTDEFAEERFNVLAISLSFGEWK